MVEYRGRRPCRTAQPRKRADRLESNALSRYAQLQKKYQAILGGREPLLVRTTMGNAAIWHRISIAADTREAAETLCSRLRAAGGSCLVQSN